jgi:hypothetical protein
MRTNKKVDKEENNGIEDDLDVLNYKSFDRRPPG